MESTGFALVMDLDEFTEKSFVRKRSARMIGRVLCFAIVVGLWHGVANAQVAEANQPVGEERLMFVVQVWEMPAIKLENATWITDQDDWLRKMVGDMSNPNAWSRFGSAAFSVYNYDRTMGVFKQRGMKLVTESRALTVPVGQTVMFDWSKELPELVAVDANDGGGDGADEFPHVDCGKLSSRIDEAGLLQFKGKLFVEVEFLANGKPVSIKQTIDTFFGGFDNGGFWFGRAPLSAFTDAVVRLETPAHRLIVVEIVRMKSEVRGE